MKELPLNPWSRKFLEQIPVVNTILRRTRERHAADQRIKRILESYKEIVSDARYKIVQDEVKTALAEDLELLIEEAAKCNHCMKYALQIRLMQKVVLDPLEQVWYDNQRARLEEQGEEMGG